jgi:hypothetical protein
MKFILVLIYSISSLIKVELKKEEEKWELFRGGEPFVIRGVYGDFDIRSIQKSVVNFIQVRDKWQIRDVINKIQRTNLTILAGYAVDSNDKIREFKKNNFQQFVEELRDEDSNLI